MPPFTLHPSLRLSGCLLMLHAGAFLCLILADIPWWLKISGTIVCLYSTWYSIQRYALLSYSKAITQCAILSDGQWQLTNHSGEKHRAFLLGDSWRSRWMLILNFKLVHSKKRLSILVCNDMLEQPILRRLRVYLNFSAETHA